MDGGHNPGHRTLPYDSVPSPSMYQTKAVIIAMIITAVVSVSVTIFCFQTKVRRGRPFPPATLPFYTYTPLGLAPGQAQGVGGGTL